MVAGPVPIEAALVGRARQRVVAAFLAAHAIGRDDAIMFTARSPGERRAFDRLVARNVILRTRDDRYYLDRTAMRTDAEHRRQRGAVIGIVIALALAGLAMSFYVDASQITPP